MRFATLMTMLAAPMALAACGSGEETAETSDMPMATQNMPMDENTSMDGKNMPMTQPGKVGQTASGEGTVTAIDAEAGTITIDHGAIPAVEWPAMAMAFAADAPSRQKVAVGDKVTFEFRKTDTGGEITSIAKR